MNFRPLIAAEVDCRVGMAGNGYMTCLLYKDARADMNILDETVGSENWQRRHYECKGNLFCSVGVKVGGEWTWKDDCGTESNTEKEKGESSDSFKRACVNWGIGRELYTAPFIYIPVEDKDGKPNYKVNDKGKPDVKLNVTFMSVENGKIVGLNIENIKLHRTVFVFGNIFPDHICAVCGKAVTVDHAQKSIAINGAVYCSGTCLKSTGK